MGLPKQQNNIAEALEDDAVLWINPLPKLASKVSFRQTAFYIPDSP